MGDAALRKVIMLRRDWRGRQCDTPVDKFFSTHRERQAQNRRDTSKSPRMGSRVQVGCDLFSTQVVACGVAYRITWVEVTAWGSRPRITPARSPHRTRLKSLIPRESRICR